MEQHGVCCLRRYQHYFIVGVGPNLNLLFHSIKFVFQLVELLTRCCEFISFCSYFVFVIFFQVVEVFFQTLPTSTANTTIVMLHHCIPAYRYYAHIGLQPSSADNHAWAPRIDYSFSRAIWRHLSSKSLGAVLAQCSTLFPGDVHGSS